MNNKRFLLISIILAGVLFLGIAFLNKPEATSNLKMPRISDDILIKQHSPIKGSVTAPVTIVEFLDPECEACRAMHPIIKQLLGEFKGQIRFVIRYMPLHKNSTYAAAVLEEAREQGKFEEALDILFESQPVWGSHQDPKPELIPTFLERLGISEDTLIPEVVIPKHITKIEIDKKDGSSAGANRTPTFFLNGVLLEQIGYVPLKEAIEKALKK